MRGVIYAIMRIKRSKKPDSSVDVWVIALCRYRRNPILTLAADGRRKPAESQEEPNE